MTEDFYRAMCRTLADTVTRPMLTVQARRNQQRLRELSSVELVQEAIAAMVGASGLPRCNYVTYRAYPRWTLSVRRLHGANVAMSRTYSTPSGIVVKPGRELWQRTRIGSVMAVVKPDHDPLPSIDWDEPVDLTDWRDLAL
jgi:hypothetical protein